MLTPAQRKTMNDRVITGNPSFSSKRDPSPTKLGDGPPPLVEISPNQPSKIQLNAGVVTRFSQGAKIK